MGYSYFSSSSESSSEYNPTWYYAVAIGRRTGIFTNHEDALNQVHGYSGFRMKKFRNRSEARDYISSFGSFCGSSTEEEEEEEKEEEVYYAVADGRCPGIYTSCDDALAQTNGYSRAKMKKFWKMTEAEEFLYENYLETGGSCQFYDREKAWFAYGTDGGIEDFPDPKHPDALVAFCDGSALGIGQRDCDAAYACIFPHSRGWDAVKKVRGPWPTNNRAAYLAALAAMRCANRQDYYKEEVLYIFTDSTVLINSMT